MEGGGGAPRESGPETTGILGGVIGWRIYKMMGLYLAQMGYLARKWPGPLLTGPRLDWR